MFEETEFIKLKVFDKGSNAIHIKVKKTTQMGKVKKSYSERTGVPMSRFCFLLDGRQINDQETPNDLKIEQEAVVKVYATINEKDLLGKTVLMHAIIKNELEQVKYALTFEDLNLAATSSTGYTALHYACSDTSSAYVALLGKDKRMTSEILNMKNDSLETALMVAVRIGNMECIEEMAKLDGVDWETTNANDESLEDVARKWKQMLVIKFLRKRKGDDDEEPSQLKKIKLSTLTLMLEDLESGKETEDSSLSDKHKKIEEEFELECKKEREEFENKQRVKRLFIQTKNQQERESFAKKQKNQMEALKSEIKERVCPKDTKKQKPASSTTLAPECPLCVESMAPPAKLYNCPEGHLLCANCRAKVENCHLCRKPLQGRATAMEQYLRAVYGLE